MLLHRITRKLAAWSVSSFFQEIHIIGEENVPEDGPIIVVSTHHNMILDPCTLSTVFPHKRPLHYWSKASLYVNPIVAWYFKKTGNIPVDRKTKDNQVLFKGTFDCLAQGEVVALFPEGTSYSEPRIMQIKDGASWSALEYAKWAQQNKTHKKPLIMVPAGIVYTDKAKYRSRVIVEFSKPIILDEYAKEFMMDDDPNRNKNAVKKLTARIEKELEMITINAPDWETLYCARIARDMLWQDKSINLDDYVAISQTIVDIFTTPALTSSYGMLKKALLTYYSLLQSTNLTNRTLSRLPLPDTLNPSRSTPLPSRLSTLFLLLGDTLGLIIRIPFFILPLLVHAPALVAARHGANIAEEEVSEAQNKLVFGFLLLSCIYPSMFFLLWILFSMTPIGAAIAFATTYAFVMYYHRTVDDNYEHAKQLITTWRVLLGVWMPRKWDLSLSALTPYITPYIPPPSEFIDKKKVKSGVDAPLSPRDESNKSPNANNTSSQQSPVSAKPPKRLVPSRRLIRHVLRARLDASRLLAEFFAELERSGKQIRAPEHLARMYGYVSLSSSSSAQQQKQEQEPTLVNTGDGVAPSSPSAVEPQGWRDAKEVIRYLRDHGANIGQLRTPKDVDWAAASSDAESFEHGSGSAETDDDLVWVPPTSSR